jgi:DegV family protein with EDD domain
MRIGIVVDSACDLPFDYLQANGIVVLPITNPNGSDVLVDDRDPAAIQHFLSEDLGARGHDAETEPFSAAQIRDLFLDRLVVDYDCVFCLTITSTRSPIHANASQASYAVLKDYRPIRRDAGVPGPFLLRVMDTGSLFAGQGVTAVEAVRLRASGASPGAMRERLEAIARNTCAFMLPRDLYYLRARAQKKGDRSVGWMTAALGSALDIKPILRAFRGETGPVAKVRGFEQGVRELLAFAARRVREGLLAPTLCLSYGGDLAELAALPGYEALRETCAAAGVEVFETAMSMTGMVNVGTGAIALGFASEHHEFAA